MSGGDGHPDPSGKALADAERIGANFARAKGIDPAAPDALERLRALPGEQVVDGLNLAAMAPRDPAAPTYSGPIVDGTVVVDMGAAYDQDRFARVPMLIGATSADIGGRTGYMVAGARDAAARLAAKGVPVWEYRFSYVANTIGKPGAQHATDIPFFFDNAAIKYGARRAAALAALRSRRRHDRRLLRRREDGGGARPLGRRDRPGAYRRDAGTVMFSTGEMGCD
jgi:para-nitrobenzyl esterase